MQLENKFEPIIVFLFYRFKVLLSYNQSDYNIMFNLDILFQKGKRGGIKLTLNLSARL